ncbi:MAG: 5'-methylthioadenosine/adenosylhomocysteine nucleosidase [Bacteroidales bacterium]|jgi:adenosylhomocysteine nucleosidase|nr:5'-methylthioadenosine/adenosylhomocysteine nucleosidase [Bacteroidales bacterium]
MKIGVIVALDQEYSELHRLLGGRAEGMIGNNEIVLAKSGIGKVNAALGAAKLINEYPLDCIVNTGVAGGLSPKLGSLDVIAAERVVYHDVWCGAGNAYGQVQGLPEMFRSHPTLYGTALSLGPKVHGGLLASGDFFISSKAEADAILARFPDAVAVDMESAAIAQTCWLHGVPFLSLRIISDVAGEDHQSEYDNFWATVAEDSFNAVREFLEALPANL